MENFSGIVQIVRGWTVISMTGRSAGRVANFLDSCRFEALEILIGEVLTADRKGILVHTVSSLLLLAGG